MSILPRGRIIKLSSCSGKGQDQSTLLTLNIDILYFIDSVAIAARGLTRRGQLHIDLMVNI